MKKLTLFIIFMFSLIFSQDIERATLDIGHKYLLHDKRNKIIQEYKIANKLNGYVKIVDNFGYEWVEESSILIYNPDSTLCFSAFRYIGKLE